MGANKACVHHCQCSARISRMLCIQTAHTYTHGSDHTERRAMHDYVAAIDWARMWFECAEREPIYVLVIFKWIGLGARVWFGVRLVVRFEALRRRMGKHGEKQRRHQQQFSSSFSSSSVGSQSRTMKTHERGNEQCRCTFMTSQQKEATFKFYEKIIEKSTKTEARIWTAK